MLTGTKIRDTAEKVKVAAADTKQAVLFVGALAAVALLVGLVALLVGARRPVAARL